MKVFFDPHTQTTLAFVTLRSDGERKFMFYRNPNDDMFVTEAELNLNLICLAKIFHIALLVSSQSYAVLPTLLLCALQKNLVSSCYLTPNIRLPLWPSEEATQDGIKSVWKEANFIKVSNNEVAFLINGDPTKEDVVLSLWFDGLKLLIVTDGKKGCRYFTNGFKRSMSGYPVKIVSIIRARDDFIGAFLHSITKDDSLFENKEKLKQALAFVNACGAICTTPKRSYSYTPNCYVGFFTSNLEGKVDSEEVRNDMIFSRLPK